MRPVLPTDPSIRFGHEVRRADLSPSVLLLPGWTQRFRPCACGFSVFDADHVLQECDVTLVPGNLYCLQGQNLYCQAHYHGDGGVPPSADPQPSLPEGERVFEALVC